MAEFVDVKSLKRGDECLVKTGRTVYIHLIIMAIHDPKGASNKLSLLVVRNLGGAWEEANLSFDKETKAILIKEGK